MLWQSNEAGENCTVALKLDHRDLPFLSFIRPSSIHPSISLSLHPSIRRHKKAVCSTHPHCSWDRQRTSSISPTPQPRPLWNKNQRVYFISSKICATHELIWSPAFQADKMGRSLTGIQLSCTQVAKTGHSNHGKCAYWWHFFCVSKTEFIRWLWGAY